MCSFHFTRRRWNRAASQMKVFLRTYGCRANQYDTEVVRSLLRASSIEEVDSADIADVAIFNSCTVTSAAEADLRADVRRAHAANPHIRNIVMGCAAAVPNRDESIAPVATLPGVDGIVAGADVSSIAALLGVPMSLDRREQTGARGLLRIQEGCDEHCTFCATTISRGANRSRPYAELIEEARRLAGIHPEIVITGIHIGSYGTDCGSSLGALMERLIADVPVVRFRLTSVEATEVDAQLCVLMIHEPRRLAPHLHAPLQSGSDRILRKMGRHWYTAKSYRESVAHLASEISTFALSGDVITGFPGETEEDHRETVRLVEDLPFTSLHVFPFSARPGTAATRLRDPVSSATARARAAELRAIAADKSASHERARIGQKCDVVTIERGKGLTEDYLSVAIADASVPRRSRFDGVLKDEGGKLTVVNSSTA
jgi:threonylcarbamoyladenosine tRNA methylthiotransferase MtaB